MPLNSLPEPLKKTLQVAAIVVASLAAAGLGAVVYAVARWIHG